MLPVMHPDAAGLDIGSEEILVAVPAERDADPVRSFGTFTRDLCEVAERCRVQTVAMESTGVYWIPLYQILETRAFQAFLVTAQHVKNVPGRKERRVGLPMDSVSAFGGIAEGQLPAAGRDLCDSVAMEAS